MSPRAASPDSPLRQTLLFDAVETSYDVTDIKGRVPEWVRGDYYINGPARFVRGGQRYRHWLDGDGFVAALHFTDQGVRFVSRFVQTRKLREENAAGRFLYRGFGTAFPGDRLCRDMMLESPANISVAVWQGRLLGFGEQALPVEMDPQSLDTVGEFDFEGKLNEVSPFSAHAKIDPANGHLLNFGISVATRQPALNVYEFAAPGTLLRRSRFPLAHQYSNHDFGFTPQHVAFFLSPYLMDFARFAGGGASVMDALTWKPELGSKILVVPRGAGAGQAFEVSAGSGYCLHLINCHEAEGRVMVDILELERPVYGDYQPLPDLFVEVPPCRPVRYIIDVAEKRLIERRAMSYDLCADFPAIDHACSGAAYQDFWFLGISASRQPGAKFFDQLARGSWASSQVDDVWQAPAGELLAGEPVLLGNPHAPDDGLVLVQHLRPVTGEAAFVMFSAMEVSRGPVVRIPLRDRLHPLFHACYCPRTER